MKALLHRGAGFYSCIINTDAKLVSLNANGLYFLSDSSYCTTAYDFFFIYECIFFPLSCFFILIL